MNPPCAVAAFGYHDVTDDPASSGLQRVAALPYKLSCSVFSRHLDAIATGPSAPELIDAVELRHPGQHLVVTFDDGGASARHAADELARRNWRGHFFVTTDRIGRPGFLTAADIQQLRRDGHVIGSHSHTHPSFFRELPWQRMTEEWRVSTDRLAQLLGEPILSASVPGGDLSNRVIWSALESGLRFLFTSEPTLQTLRIGDCWVLGRYVPKVSTSVRDIRELASLRGWDRAMLWRQLKLRAKALVPGLFRLYVRARTVEA